MKLARRKFLRLAAGAAALAAGSRIAMGQGYPSRPISMIMPYGAGTITDSFGRIIAERMRGSLGQPIIIENVTGAEGSIGLGRLVRARPDGYTIEFGTLGNHVQNGVLYSLPYDVLNDFAPIGPLATAPLILFARNTIPSNDLKEFFAWLKANSNKASAGFGASGPRIVTAFFQIQSGASFILVPYRGGAMQGLVGGQIDFAFNTPDQLPLMRAGTVKAYGSTGDTRSALAPDIPTFAEMGLPALSYSAWGGLFAPKGTPRDVINKLNVAAMEALSDPAVQSRLLALGVEIFPRERQTPEALGALVKADAEKWWPIIKELGIKAE